MSIYKVDVPKQWGKEILYQMKLVFKNLGPQLSVYQPPTYRGK